MKTKRLIAGIVSVVTLAAVSSSAIVSAADFTASISSKEVAAGDEFSLELNLANIPASGLNAIEFGISFDAALISIDKVELGALAKDLEESTSDGTALPPAFDTAVMDGVVNVMYSIGTEDASNYIKGEGTFVTINGSVKADAKAGETKLEIVPIERAEEAGVTAANEKTYFATVAADGTVTEHAPTCEPGIITIKGEVDPSDDPTEDKPTEATAAPVSVPTDADSIKDAVWGDVNEDGQVAVSDLVLLNQYLLKDETALNTVTAQGLVNANVDFNDEINQTDSTYLLNALSNQIGKNQLGKQA
ncbi:MAG: cohesin domain-containing protein [Clostridium sp.]|nr:cohesin domain-containing protein [Clostridium sp.]MCM1547882.1 cohesin domain-containing protein [Ruminococcus sp.]